MKQRSLSALPRVVAAGLALALCGCHHAVYQAQGLPPPASANVASATITTSTGPWLGTAMVVGIVAAETYNYYSVDQNGMKTPVLAPDPDPTRRINVQDCTKPIEPRAGNLMCR
jgi:hypothetical protein